MLPANYVSARAIDAHRRTPSLVERLRASIGTVAVASAADPRV